MKETDDKICDKIQLKAFMNFIQQDNHFQFRFEAMGRNERHDICVRV